MKVADYMDEIRKGKFVPKDPFSHATMLIETEEEAVKLFSKIVEKQVILSNIDDDRMLRLYQNDAVLLTSLFSMANRAKDGSLSEFFFAIYYGWRGELALTRTKDGLERKLQGTVSSSKYAPTDALRGYGADMIPAQGSQETELGMLQKLMPKFKKPKG